MPALHPAARRLPTTAFAIISAVLSACSSPAKPDPQRKAPASAADSAKTGPDSDPAEAATSGVRVFAFEGGGDLAAFVAERHRQALADERVVVVYVGAQWCEPCRYFHDAVAGGQLDAEFPTLDLVEVDFDANKGAIQAAGYGARLLPTFALPGDDGRGTGVMEQGGIKGPKAVDYLRPRLRALVQKAQRG